MKERTLRVNRVVRKPQKRKGQAPGNASGEHSSTVMGITTRYSLISMMKAKLGNRLSSKMHDEQIQAYNPRQVPIGELQNVD